MEPSKRDWKLFRDKIGTWQERYMEKQQIKNLSHIKKEVQRLIQVGWMIFVQRTEAGMIKRIVRLRISK